MRLGGALKYDNNTVAKLLYQAGAIIPDQSLFQCFKQRTENIHGLPSNWFSQDILLLRRLLGIYLPAHQIKDGRLLLLVLIFLTACATTPAVSQTADTPDAVQEYVNASASQATAVAAVATAQYFTAGLTATADGHNQSATQQAFDLQATQQADNILSTARAWNATSTSSSVQATQSASGTATASAVQAIWTQHAVDITSTADMASVEAYATEQYASARTDELTLERREMMNNVAAVTPWAAFGIAFLAAILLVFRWSRVRVIPRDERGDAPLLLDLVDVVSFDPDRNPSSAGGLTRQDLKQLPEFTSAERLQVTAHDQLLDVASRTPNEVSRKILSAPSPFENGTPPKIQVLDPSQARPLFQDVIPHLLQDAIDADVILNDPEEGETNHE